MTVAKARRALAPVLLSPAERIAPLREAFMKLSTANIQLSEQTINHAAYILAFHLAADADHPPASFHSGRKDSQAGLDAARDAAILLSEKLNALSNPVVNGLAREGAVIEVLLDSLRDLIKCTGSVDISWMAEKKPGPEATRSTLVAFELRNWFAQITGRPATVGTSYDGEAYGEFFQLTQTVFEIIGYPAPESRARFVTKKVPFRKS